MARAGTRSTRTAKLPMAVTLIVTLVGAAPAAAADDDAALVLPGRTSIAVTVDLDDDGDREIIRVTQAEEPLDRSDHELDVWTHDGSSWTMLGSRRLGVRLGEEVPSAGSTGVAVLPWMVAGRERILVFSAELAADDPTGASCCLVVAEVTLTASDRVALEAIQTIDSAAQSFLAADVDGDRTDELILHESAVDPASGEESAALTVLRWSGSRFEQVFEDSNERWLFGFTVAETDGIPGDDILFGPSVDGSLERLVWSGGRLRSEEAHLDLGGPDEGSWVAGVAGGTILISLVDEFRTVRWPREAEPVTTGSLPTLSYPAIMVVGDGPDALVGLQEGLAFERGEAPTMILHDLALQRLGEVEVSAQTEEFWSISLGQAGAAWTSMPVNLWPYTGPLAGLRVGGRPAFAASGMLIQPGGPAGYEARPMGSLIGMQPIGVAGPDDAWAVLSDSIGPTSGAFLVWGGMSFGEGRLVVTTVDRLLRPDEEVPAASFDLRDAVELRRDGAEATLAAAGDGFQLIVRAPPGTRVLVAHGTRLEDHEMDDEPLTVDIMPRERGPQDTNQEFEAMIVLLSPDGRGTTQRWTGTFVREPPHLSVRATTDAMELRATLSGEATPGSEVMANGRPIVTDAQGRFETSIDAPIWPSQVQVVARDPLGTEVSESIEVVGVVDYRGLPWAAIILLATLVVGAVLYVRTPRRRAVPVTTDGDGRLEELELDVIDGMDPRGR